MHAFSISLFVQVDINALMMKGEENESGRQKNQVTGPNVSNDTASDAARHSIFCSTQGLLGVICCAETRGCIVCVQALSSLSFLFYPANLFISGTCVIARR